MPDENEMLTRQQLEEIVNKLAWRGTDAENDVRYAYGIDYEAIPRLMGMFGYEWDSDAELWASTRDIWRDGP